MAQSPAKFKKLHTPVVVTSAHWRALKQIYPYDLWSYTKLNRSASEFLIGNFLEWKSYTDVYATTNHNGNGRQWGIIVLRDRLTFELSIVAEFGHRPGGLLWRIRFTRWLSRYFHHDKPCEARQLKTFSTSP